MQDYSNGSYLEELLIELYNYYGLEKYSKIAGKLMNPSLDSTIFMQWSRMAQVKTLPSKKTTKNRGSKAAKSLGILTMGSNKLFEIWVKLDFLYFAFLSPADLNSKADFIEIQNKIRSELKSNFKELNGCIASMKKPQLLEKRQSIFNLARMANAYFKSQLHHLSDLKLSPEIMTFSLLISNSNNFIV